MDGAVWSFYSRFSDYSKPNYQDLVVMYIIVYIVVTNHFLIKIIMSHECCEIIMDGTEFAHLA